VVPRLRRCRFGLVEGNGPGEARSRFVHHLAFSPEEMLIAVLAFATDVARTHLDLGFCATEVTGAPIRHQSVHDEVELYRAVVRGKLRWQEREVGVECGYQSMAVGEAPSFELILDVSVDVVSVGGIYNHLVDMRSLLAAVVFDMFLRFELVAFRLLSEDVGDEVVGGRLDVGRNLHRVGPAFVGDGLDLAVPVAEIRLGCQR
jgi:hypothetical protein